MNLVERLRDYSRYDTDVMMDEAADELERLTAERDMLVEALEKVRGASEQWQSTAIATEALAKVKKP
jgi:hypothetical protein